METNERQLEQKFAKFLYGMDDLDHEDDEVYIPKSVIKHTQQGEEAMS